MGVLSILPLLWTILILITVFGVSTKDFLSDSPSRFGQLGIETIRIGVPVAIVIVLIVTAYDFFVLIKSDLPESRKILWIVLLLMWFPLAAPVFWYRRIWSADVARTTR